MYAYGVFAFFFFFFIFFFFFFLFFFFFFFFGSYNVKEFLVVCIHFLYLKGNQCADNMAIGIEFSFIHCKVFPFLDVACETIVDSSW